MYKTFQDFLRAEHASDSEAAEKLLQMVFALEPELSSGDPEKDVVYVREYVDVWSQGTVTKLCWREITLSSWTAPSLEVWMDVDAVGSTVRLLYTVDEPWPESYSCHDFPDAQEDSDREFEVFCKALESMRKAQVRI